MGTGSSDRDVIYTERLALMSVGPDFLRAALRGHKSAAERISGVDLPERWIDGVAPIMRYRLNQIDSDPDAQPWLLRLITKRSTGEFVGYVNFHAPPGSREWVEIGYEIEPAHRRLGYATEAALGFFTWAADRKVTRFRASIGPTNEPSLAMIRKLGFERVGVQWDEIDGEEIVFEIDADVLLGRVAKDR